MELLSTAYYGLLQYRSNRPIVHGPRWVYRGCPRYDDVLLQTAQYVEAYAVSTHERKNKTGERVWDEEPALRGGELWQDCKTMISSGFNEGQTSRLPPTQ